jgi:hypothetical protein
VDELIALLGRNWRLLLVYPGGLAALGCIALTQLLLGRWPSHGRSAISWRGGEIMTAALWLLLIALLPLPQTGWPYALDLIILLLLFEIPAWLHWHGRGANVAQAAALLNVYPLLALSIAALGLGAGSLVAQEINRSSGLLHWAGIAGWACALPPLLGLGPWQEQHDDILATIRRVAHLGLLLAVTLPANNDTPIVDALIGWTCMILPLAAIQRWWRGDGRWWLGWQPWLVAALTLLLAWTSGQELLTRLR